MDWNSFILGVLASLLAGFPFFYFSARSLRREAEKLRTMVNTLARGLESHGVAKFNWDNRGNMIGVVHFAKLILQAKTSMDANLQIQKQHQENQIK